jgi:large subunit ribosomal protein L32e
MAASSIKQKITKKRTKKFKRFQQCTLNKTKGNFFIRMRTGWRKPKGIDNRVRRKFLGTTRMPKIGYGSAKKTRHMLPNGFYKFTVSTTADLDMLLMHNTKFAVEVAHNVSSRKRKEIVERAQQLGLHILNKFARVQAVEEAD